MPQPATATPDRKPVDVIIAEDEDGEYNALFPIVDKYFNNISRPCNVTRYVSGKKLIQEYKKADIILMDIELEETSGMEAALKIREKDENVIIIFCTKMAQFAVKGYEVDALDFIVKPFTYESLAYRLNRAMKRLDSLPSSIMVKTKEGMVTVDISNLLYIDVYGHSLGYHMKDKTIYAWGSLTKLETELRPQGMLRCSNSILVNKKHISVIHGKEITLSNGEVLEISRQRHKAFLEALAEFVSR